MPLYCANVLRGIVHHARKSIARSTKIVDGEISQLVQCPISSGCWLSTTAGCRRRWTARSRLCSGFSGVFVLSFALYPLVGISFFPRTDAGQFVINVKAPTGTRLEVTEDYVKKVEDIVRQVVHAARLEGDRFEYRRECPIFRALTTPNSAMHTAFIQVGLQGRPSSQQLRLHGRSPKADRDETCRNCAPTFNPADLVDSVLNQGMPAPIDVQVSGSGSDRPPTTSLWILRRNFKRFPDVSDVYVPQDMDYPALQVNVNRERASELGLDPKEVVDNLITALTSDAMIAPSYWVDPKSGNNYFVTVSIRKIR